MTARTVTPIISLSLASALGMGAADFEALAAWHDEKAEHVTSQADRLRHEVLSYRLSRCAQAMRGSYRHAA